MSEHEAGELLTETLRLHLRERCRILSRGCDEPTGALVLYWMHHAVRGHENPALDAAVALANERGLPLLVYQGLGGNHAYNNDRHHAFILQGARDAHRELAGRGIDTAFHLDRTGKGSSPLPRLAARAAVVVVEDYPAPPFPAWTARLAEHSPAPVIAVDCFCTVPMRAQPKRFDRAFAFRRHNSAEFGRRVPLPWPDPGPVPPRFEGELGFEPLDLERADLVGLCAECEIDHGIPPVAHTVGGSRAGYRRWGEFRDKGLRAYARERNDAAVEWPRGVSRLSPYLHHGHVSPFRIAREAWQAGGDGAEKLLDELLVWRELAFNCCFHCRDPGHLDALPDWARSTLREHAADPRPVIRDTEALARSRTGDRLWDLAQASLRIHGELHNNLRMTWAKAIPFWRPDPQSALDCLIELNHRYALDGSDPNSYGGLLWALGLFDRPFPDSPVTGKLRRRSSESHSRRLDLQRYGRRVLQPSTGQVRRIAVVGAGISGLTAARTLQDQGHQVTLFEKSRGPGGRAATRDLGACRFDHGAQYFTVRDPAFGRAVAAWQEAGVVAAWVGRLGQVVRGQIEPFADGQQRLVGVPGMNALGRHLASDLALRTESRVAPPRRVGDHWVLESDAGAPLGDFDFLILAVPAPQARELLAPSVPRLARRAAAVEYAPAWTLMLALAEKPPLPFEGLFFRDGPLGWAAQDGAKPGRRGHSWVIHAAPDWTRDHLESPVEEVARDLASAFAAQTGTGLAGITAQVAHRWRYARPENPLGTGSLWDSQLALGLCGDWCHSARVEGAYLSGLAVAGRLLGELVKEGQR
jgi:photolyase PhrII